MSAKISVSVPDDLFRRLEEVRQSRGIGRSTAVQRALRRWTASEDETVDWDWAFVEAYRRLPQSPEEAGAWLEAELGTWEKRPVRRGRRGGG